jgi:tetratricopeptide (TPR) repeat protein
MEDIPDWINESREVEAEEPSSADDTRVWLRNLEKEESSVAEAQERLEEQSDWLKQTEDVRAEEPSVEPPVAEEPAYDTAAWLQSLDKEEAAVSPESSSRDDTAIWLEKLDEPEPEAAPPQPTQAIQPEELPAWMQDIEAEQPPATETTAPEVAGEATEETEWMASIEQEPPVAPKVETGSLPSWLRGLEEEEKQSVYGAQEDLPSWLRDETGEVVAEPTQATDWQPVESKQPEPSVPEQVAPPPQPEPVDVVAIIEEKIEAVSQEPEKPAPPPKPQKEPPTRKVTGMLTDPILGQARSELSRSNLPIALENYDRLIKKGRLLEDVIYDLREASYRYPVEVSIWQSLGDAYMRSNRLQDALDAYTKAEELLR